jgi:hypothetical protein
LGGLSTPPKESLANGQVARAVHAPGAAEGGRRGLVNKYRAIFGWAVPEVDEPLSSRLIVQALQPALAELAKEEVHSAHD